MEPTVETNNNTGALDRPDDISDRRDYRHEEIAMAFAPAVWKEKSFEEFFRIPASNQGIAFNCVAHKFAKQLGVENMNLNTGTYRALSAHSIYPFGYAVGGGMNVRTAGGIVLKKGATLESLFPSENIPEEKARSADEYLPDAKQIAFIFKPDSVVYANPDFETIASILYNYQQAGIKKAVGILIIGKNNGTWGSTFPQPPKSKVESNLWYHAIVATDFGIIDGKKYIATVGSWGNDVGINGVQFLGESYEPFIYAADYVTKAAYGSGYPTVNPPVHTWTTNLDVGDSGPEVLALQIALQSMGFFPIDSIQKPTGSYFGITRSAIKTFQQAFALPITGAFDDVTRAKFNEIFGVK